MAVDISSTRQPTLLAAQLQHRAYHIKVNDLGHKYSIIIIIFIFF